MADHVFSVDETPEPPKKQQTKDLPEPEKITVHVTRSNGHYQIKCNQNLPTANLVVAELHNRDYSRYANDYLSYTLTELMNSWHGAISASEWQEAILSALLRQSKPVNEAEPIEVVNLTNTYMAMGNQLFKLQPVKVIKANGALRAVRARATAASKREGERIIEDARRSCKGITDEAAKLLSEAKAKLAEANRVLTPPAWTQGFPVRLREQDRYFEWFVGTVFNFFLTQFHYSFSATNAAGRAVVRTKIWNAKPEVPAFKVRLWIPCNSSDTSWFTKCFVDESSPALPHIKQSHACGSSGAAPRRITSIRDVTNAAVAMQNMCTVANLNSLLVYEQYWEQRIRDFVPPALWAVIQNHAYTSTPASESALRALACGTTEDDAGGNEWTAPATDTDAA